MMRLPGKLTNIIKNEEFQFKVDTALKFVLISMGFCSSVLLFTYLLLKIDLLYFVENGYSGASEFQDTYYQFIFSSLLDGVPYLIGSMFLIFFLGFHLSSVMIRPFKKIGTYCEERLSKNHKSFYSPDYFSDLKLLTSFSVFFFTHIDDAKTKGKLLRVEVPNDYTRIHKPVFEKNFFINYLFIIVIFALLASVGIFVLNNIIREQVVTLSQKLLSNAHLPGGKGVRYFIEEQFSVADIAVYFLLVLHVLTYFIFGIHLFGKISGPAFAIFATMRSFLKGNYHNRVHLIGYSYLRDDCRKINKYLDSIQKELT